MSFWALTPFYDLIGSAISAPDLWRRPERMPTRARGLMKFCHDWFLFDFDANVSLDFCSIYDGWRRRDEF